MTKVIRFKKPAKLLSWIHCEKVRNCLNEEFLTCSQKDCTVLDLLPLVSKYFLPRIKHFPVTTTLPNDWLGSRLKLFI